MIQGATLFNNFQKCVSEYYAPCLPFEIGWSAVVSQDMGMN